MNEISLFIHLQIINYFILICCKTSSFLSTDQEIDIVKAVICIIGFTSNLFETPLTTNKKDNLILTLLLIPTSAYGNTIY